MCDAIKRVIRLLCNRRGFITKIFECGVRKFHTLQLLEEQHIWLVLLQPFCDMTKPCTN